MSKLFFTVIQMRTIGKRQSEWSDDDHKFKSSGDEYVRILAKMDEDDHSVLKLEVSGNMAKNIRVSDRLGVNVTDVTSVTSRPNKSK